MANPRYSPPPERTSPRDRKLQTLQSLMAVSQTGQQSGQEQQMLDQRDQQAKMQALLGMLGLVQSGQQHKDQMQAHTSDAELAAKTHAADVKAQVIGGLADRNVPGATEALGGMFPELATAQQKIQQDQLDKQGQGFAPLLDAKHMGAKVDLPPMSPEQMAATQHNALPVARSSYPDAGKGTGPYVDPGTQPQTPVVPPAPPIFSLNAAGGPNIDLQQLWQALKRGAASSAYGGIY